MRLSDVTSPLPSENGDQPTGLSPLPKPTPASRTLREPREMLNRLEERMDWTNGALYDRFLDLYEVTRRLRPASWLDDDPVNMATVNDWLKAVTALGLFGQRLVRALRDQRVLYLTQADKDAAPEWIEKALDELREELGWDV